jgi:phage shock protein E
MNWIALLFVVLVFVALLWIRKLGQISAKDAHMLLRNGAMVVDVRTAGEFVSGHLPLAVNLPLNEIETDLPHFVRHKGQVMLLHCHSGVRSGIAMKKLKALGYAHVYNLGSYERATSIVNGQ